MGRLIFRALQCEMEPDYIPFSGIRRNFSWGGFQSSKICLCIKIESMIRKNIKQAAIQYVNVVKQL